MKRFFQRFKKKNISDKKESFRQEDKYIPDELILTKVGKKEASPLNGPVWKASLLVVLGSFLLGLLRPFSDFYNPITAWFLALIALATWGFAVRMLLMDAKLKKLWVGWLILSGVLTIFLSRDESLWIAAVGGSFVFLLFRKYKPYRHLTSRRRAALFLLGLLVFILLSIGGSTPPSTESAELLPSEGQAADTVAPAATSLGVFLGRYATGSLELFWFFSLLHLFLRARLHFVKLKPKLAISAILIAVVPLILVILMGFLILYGTLGASRAIQARSILYDWKSISESDENFIPSVFMQSFKYEKAADGIPTQVEIPIWLQGFLSSLRTKESPYVESKKREMADYFWLDSGLWLIRIQKETDEFLSIQGGRVDQSMLNHLAQIVRTDVSFVFSSSVKMTIAGTPVRLVESEDGQPIEKVQGKYIAKDASPKDVQKSSRSFWRRPLYFGMTDIDVVSLVAEKFEQRKTLLLIEVSIVSILNELISQKNPFSLAVMIALSALAVSMFIFEAFMFFFGVRITTGFTSAVRSLHRGTKRIAAGDLDTKIEIPNEDELGDLAVSFNAMAKAVKKGREEAILRAHLESELETARKIQEKLLPHEMPQLPGFEIAGTSIPSKQVGGDYFDFLDLGKGRLGIAIADVSGKGIPAALLMANLQASLHAQTMETVKVAEVANRINNLLVKSTDANMFVTFFYGLLDRNQSTFTSTNAGHNPPLLLRADQSTEHLAEGGLVLGFLPDQNYAQQTTILFPGDILVLYTDGITEAREPEEKKAVEDKLFGEVRLVHVVKESASLSAREIQSAILQTVSAHTKNTPQGDDITLVVIKRREA
ncbi:MAG: SpoIIE family protein phosphatase [Candidatus Aminicenantes bacterium]|nr:MAG: SpoIIE family protein phosphatase [Candidatus Aminicenantes bacterium]